MKEKEEKKEKQSNYCKREKRNKEAWDGQNQEIARESI